MKLPVKILIALTAIAILGVVITLIKVDSKPTISSGESIELTGQLIKQNGIYQIVKSDLSGTMLVANIGDPAVEKALKSVIGKTVHVYGKIVTLDTQEIAILWMNNHLITEKQPDSTLTKATVATDKFQTIFQGYTVDARSCIAGKFSTADLNTLLAKEVNQFTQKEIETMNSCFSATKQ